MRRSWINCSIHVRYICGGRIKLVDAVAAPGAKGKSMHRIRRRCFTALSLFAFAFLSLLGCIPTISLGVSPEKVDAALERAKAFVYSQQRGGLWDTPKGPTATEAEAAAHSMTAGQWGGQTALSVYALLAAGESPQDNRLAPAIKFLTTAEIRGTYALGLRAQIWLFLPPTRETRQQASGDVARLGDAMITKGPAEGLYDYLLDSKRSVRVDHSVSQYGVLGMWACERSGAEVPTPFWRAVENAWIRDQGKDGSWSYAKAPLENYPETASMTAAGIATLFITQDYVHASNGINCTGNVSNPHIDAGLKWMGENFEHVFTDTSLYHPYYALYGVERIGVASGRKYLGSINWYERGTDYLLKNQDAKSGSWGNNIDTCLAMLFLARGRAPVLFNKLQYDANGKEGEWNERPRDIANLVHWIGKKTERDLNWQIVDLKGPVSDLLDAPVLYISGNKPLAFSPGEEAKLREYCEDGGLIMGNPDCGSSAFSESFRKLGTHLFKDYEFRNLPLNDPIYTSEQYPRSSWKPAPTVLGISNGVRELMLLTNNSDPARHWQLEETGHNLADFELADDIVLYAIDKKNLTEKGKTFVVTTDPAIPTNRTIKLARLQYAGNWNPEPGGWRRMAAILHNNSHIDLQMSVARLGSNQLGDGKTGATVATLTGTSEFKLTAPQRQEIKDFVDGGGTLIVDAAGGDSEFATAAESELQSIFGDDAARQLKTNLPATDSIFNLPGGAIKEFTYRSFARASVGNARTPMLSAVTLGHRQAVFYSRMDLSGGLVGQPTDGVIGYDPAIATAIMTNLVVYGGLGEHASVGPTDVKPPTPPVKAPARPAAKPKPKA
jgi:hypothetical protein